MTWKNILKYEKRSATEEQASEFKKLYSRLIVPIYGTSIENGFNLVRRADMITEGIERKLDMLYDDSKVFFNIERGYAMDLIEELEGQFIDNTGKEGVQPAHQRANIYRTYLKELESIFRK